MPSDTPPVAAAKMARAELKPCPMCGKSAHIIPRHRVMECGRLPDWERAQCTACGLTQGDFPSEELAALNWNRRAEPARDAAMEAEVEELRSQNATLLAQRDAADRAGRERIKALKECADDLEAELKARHFMADGKPHPALQHDYDNDMAVVLRARALIAPAESADGGKA